jgi:hypothetical protein
MEGAPHTAKNNWCVLEGAPASVYKGGRGEEAGLGRAKWEESHLDS